eukprot:3274133-Amphidinium_carterae.2
MLMNLRDVVKPWQKVNLGCRPGSQQSHPSAKTLRERCRRLLTVIWKQCGRGCLACNGVTSRCFAVEYIELPDWRRIGTPAPLAPEVKTGLA